MKKIVKWCLLGCLLVASVSLTGNTVQAEGETNLVAESSHITTSKTYALVQYVYLNNNGESVPVSYDLIEIPKAGSITVTPKQIDGFVLDEHNNHPREVTQAELASGFPINFTGTVTKDLPMVQPPRYIHVVHALYRDSSFSTDAHVSSEFEQVWVYPGETSIVSAKSIPGYTYKGRLDGDLKIVDTQTTITTAYRYSPGVWPILDIVVLAYVKDTDSLPMYRLYDRTTNQHFYTSNTKEVNLLQSRGWRNEGIAWKVSSEKTGSPVYRVWNVKTGERIFTRNKNEADTLVSRGWKNEGVSFYTQNSGQSIYRLRNKKTSKYLLTVGQAEVAKLVSTGQWQNEGVAFYGVQ